MAKEKTVSFPKLLDDFGIGLTKISKELEKDLLKPALISDIMRAINLIFGLQQLTTMMYNVNIQNYGVLMNRIIAIEQKTQKLEEKIIDLEKEERISIKTIIKNIEENAEVRQTFKKLLT